MKYKNIILLTSIFFVLIGCSSSPTITNDKNVYSVKLNRFLTGKEIRAFISGKTMVFNDKAGTREYYHPNGILYVYYQKNEEYTNGHWCVVNNKLCLDYEGFNLDCPTIRIENNGKVFYDNEEYATINNKDKYHIRKEHTDNNWDINEKTHCK